MEGPTFKEKLTDAIRYWEPRRFVYNGVLGLIVVIYFVIGYPGSKSAIKFDGVVLIFILAVLANVAYCAVYFVDVFAQATDFRPSWQKYRWVLFMIGTLFAAAITRFWAMGLFASSSR